MVPLKSFIPVLSDSHFPIQNLPYGIFKTSIKSPRPISHDNLFDGPHLSDSDSDCFHQPTLKKFIALGRPAWKEARQVIQTLLSGKLYLRSQVEMLLSVQIGDYSDFYASLYHATNCGKILSGQDVTVLINWFSLPIAYHGCVLSIVVLGTDVGAIVGLGNELGKAIDINEAKDHIFGLVLVNDWSARDIQYWEMLPLGSFLGKSFGMDIPTPLPYLTDKPRHNYDILLEVSIKPSGLCCLKEQLKTLVSTHYHVTMNNV
ncbi:hypothetical protein V2J09_003287 [Rumex salicifolius]